MNKSWIKVKADWKTNNLILDLIKKIYNKYYQNSAIKKVYLPSRYLIVQS